MRLRRPVLLVAVVVTLVALPVGWVVADSLRAPPPGPVTPIELAPGGAEPRPPPADGAAGAAPTGPAPMRAGAPPGTPARILTDDTSGDQRDNGVGGRGRGAPDDGGDGGGGGDDPDEERWDGDGD